jgi:hypothetical protein
MEILILICLLPCILASGHFKSLHLAYSTGHSTKTGLLRLFNRIYQSVDSKQITAMVSLNLSAAFLNVKPKTLLQRLHTDFSTTDRSLRWLELYLVPRTRYMMLGQHCSSLAVVSSSVLQGSVLGLIMFTIYISPLDQLTASHGIQHHQYTDDTQLFVAMNIYTVQG